MKTKQLSVRVTITPVASYLYLVWGSGNDVRLFSIDIYKGTYAAEWAKKDGASLAEFLDVPICEVTRPGDPL